MLYEMISVRRGLKDHSGLFKSFATVCSWINCDLVFTAEAHSSCPFRLMIYMYATQAHVCTQKQTRTHSYRPSDVMIADTGGF